MCITTDCVEPSNSEDLHNKHAMPCLIIKDDPQHKIQLLHEPTDQDART